MLRESNDESHFRLAYLPPYSQIVTASLETVEIVRPLPSLGLNSIDFLGRANRLQEWRNSLVINGE
jgi:hypothetical protein